MRAPAARRRSAYPISVATTRLVTRLDQARVRRVQSAPPTLAPRLRLIDAATGAKTTLATGFFERQLSFSPDSTQPGLRSNRRLEFVLSSRSKLQRDRSRHAGDQTDARLRRSRRPPGGRTEIAFAMLKPRGGRNYTFDIAVVQPDGSGFRRLTRFRPDADLFGPNPVAWSADGKRLLAGIDGRDAWTARESFAIDAVRGGVRLDRAPRLAGRAQPGRPLRDRPDGRRRPPVSGSNVVRVPWAGGRKRVLLRQAVNPSFNG